MVLETTLIIGLINVIAGLLILLIPGLLRFLVGAYLLVIGLIMVVGQLL